MANNLTQAIDIIGLQKFVDDNLLNDTATEFRPVDTITVMGTDNVRMIFTSIQPDFRVAFLINETTLDVIRLVIRFDNWPMLLMEAITVLKNTTATKVLIVKTSEDEILSLHY